MTTTAPLVMMDDYLRSRGATATPSFKAAPTGGFQPMTTAAPPRVPLGQTFGGASAHPADASPSPVRVELIHENGHVSRVIVICACGERHELECAY